jgi:hypothetical protein
MLRIRLNSSGAKVATVSLGGEPAVNMIITKMWGFVVVKTPARIQVFDPSGLSVSSSENGAVIKSWVAFRSHDGFDFVAYDDGVGRLWYFEAIDPGRIEAIGVGKNVCAFRFDWRTGRFVVVYRNGRIRFYPMGGR